jgi:hypothetical protein
MSHVPAAPTSTNIKTNSVIQDFPGTCYMRRPSNHLFRSYLAPVAMWNKGKQRDHYSNLLKWQRTEATFRVLQNTWSRFIQSSMYVHVSVLFFILGSFVHVIFFFPALLFTGKINRMSKYCQ